MNMKPYLILVLLIFLIETLEGEVIVVSKTTPACINGDIYFEKIQDAVNYSKSGDSIYIWDRAFYNETVIIINKSNLNKNARETNK